MNNLKELFTNTYLNNTWGSGGESRSGAGSSLAYTVHFRKNLLDIINDNKIKTIFDCSCGDWNWMKEIKDFLPNYIGNDIVTEMIESNIQKYESDNIKFICSDMLDTLKKYKNKNIDLIICRHTLEHLPNDYVINVITEIKRVAKFALITSNNGNNSELDLNDGHHSRLINLDKDMYYEILGNAYKKYYDSIDEPSNVLHTNCNFYKFK